MDKKLKAETWALVLLLIAFPITSWGTTGGIYLVWWVGFISLIAGGVLPVWTRYMDHSADTIRDVGMEFDDRTS
ncbi:hypothetical protein V1291_000695 [Nitrobacteraceae bacterium AZCC 1564]